MEEEHPKYQIVIDLFSRNFHSLYPFNLTVFISLSLFYFLSLSVSLLPFANSDVQPQRA